MSAVIAAQKDVWWRQRPLLQSDVGCRRRWRRATVVRQSVLVGLSETIGGQMIRRRASAYLSRRRGLHLRPRLLRTAELNAAGWGAVVLLSLAGAGIAHGAARASGSTSKALAPVGALACLVALVAADRRRWGRMETSYSWTRDPDDVARIGVLLQRHGVPVRVDTDDERGPRLRYRNRDARRVRRELHRAGVAPLASR